MVRGVVKLISVEAVPLGDRAAAKVVLEAPFGTRGPAFGVRHVVAMIDAGASEAPGVVQWLRERVGARMVVTLDADAQRSEAQERERARAFLAKRWHKGSDLMGFYPGDLAALLVEYARASSVASAETIPAPAPSSPAPPQGGEVERASAWLRSVGIYEGHRQARAFAAYGRTVAMSDEAFARFVGEPAPVGPAAYVDASAPKGLTFTVSVGSPNLAGGITIKGLSLDDVCEALKLSDVDRARLLSCRPGEGVTGARHAAVWTVTREPLAETETLTGFWPSTTLDVHASVKVPEPWARVLKQVRDGTPLGQGDHAAAEVLQVLGLCYRPTGWPWALTGVGSQVLSAHCAAERDAAAQPAGAP